MGNYLGSIFGTLYNIDRKPSDWDLCKASSEQTVGETSKKSQDSDHTAMTEKCIAEKVTIILVMNAYEMEL